MALGDKIVRTDNSSPSIEGPMALSDVGEDVAVQDTTESLGEQVNRGNTAPEVNVPQSLGEAAVRNRREVPQDDDLTPQGAPAPSEVKALGNAIKKAGEIAETPGGPEAARAAGVEVVPTPSAGQEVEEGSANLAQQLGQSPRARRGGVSERGMEAARGQAGEGGIGDFLTNPATVKGVAALGKAIDPSESEPLGDFAMRNAEAQAQDEFRARLQRFGEEGAEAPAGISPEGAQSVLQAFRGEQAREEEQALQERRTDIEEEATERELDQQAQRILLDERELGIQARGQERQLGLEERRTAIAERDQDLQEEMGQVEQGVMRAREMLMKARAANLGQEETQMRRQFLQSQIEEANKVAETLQEKVTSVQERLRETQETKEGILRRLPEVDVDWFSSNDPAEQAYDTIVSEARELSNQDEDLNFGDAIEQVKDRHLAEAASEHRPDIERALQLEAQRRGLEDQVNRLSQQQQRYFDIVRSALQDEGSEPTQGTTTRSTGPESNVPSFESTSGVNAAAQSGDLSDGDVVRYQGQLKQYNSETNQLEPLQ